MMIDILYINAQKAKKDHVLNVINPKLREAGKNYPTELRNKDGKGVQLLDYVVDCFACAFIFRKLSDFMVSKNGMVWIFDIHKVRHKFKLNLRQNRCPYLFWQISKGDKKEEYIIELGCDTFYQMLESKT